MEVLKGFITLVMLAVAVFGAASAVRRDAHRNIIGVRLTVVVAGVVPLILWLALSPAIGQVPAGTRGVVLRFGAATGQVKAEGLYVVTPFIESVELMSVQTEALEAPAEAASNDLQDVRAKVTLNYSLNPDQVAVVYANLRRDYERRIVAPAVQEAVKASTAKFRADELIIRRQEVKESIVQNLTTRLAAHGIRVDTVSITDFKFSDEFQRAIEAKATANQLAAKAERDLQRIRLEAQQQIEQAKAQAEALRLQKQQVTAELIQLRRIEAQLKAIDKWNGQLPNLVTRDAVPILDVFAK